MLGVKAKSKRDGVKVEQDGVKAEQAVAYAIARTEQAIAHTKLDSLLKRTASIVLTGAPQTYQTD